MDQPHGPRRADVVHRGRRLQLPGQLPQRATLRRADGELPWALQALDLWESVGGRMKPTHCLDCAAPLVQPPTARRLRCVPCAKVKNREALPPKQKVCVYCAGPFQAVRPEAMYCSNRCKQMAWGNRDRPFAAERGQVRRLLSLLRGVLQEKRRAEKRSSAASKVASRTKARKCLACECALGRQRSHYCSEQCRAIGADARRARERIKYGKTGVSAVTRLGGVVERVSRIRVFELAGWRCQSCGVETPRTLLKDCKSKCAPTLDHIVPKVLGGSHTYENVQCLCRSCNSRKGWSMPSGQRPALVQSSLSL